MVRFGSFLFAGFVAAALAVAPAGAEVLSEVKVPGGKVVRAVANPDGTHKVTVGDGQVFSDEGSLRVDVSGPYVGGGKTYVAIQLASGGSACPATYRVIDLSGPFPRLTDEFGTCSDIPEFKVGKDGALKVAMPKFDGKGKEAFTVADGVLVGKR